MSAGSALKKIAARAKALKKKHPGKKYKTLQKQAGAEYRAGKLKAKRKPAKRKPARKKTAKRKTHRRKVGKPATVVYSLGKLFKKRKRRRATPKRTQKRRRSVSGSGSSLMPILLVGGLGILAYMMLKPTVPALYQSTNPTRNANANNIVAYATAAGLGVSAITQLINALNNMSDDDVNKASNNPASVVAPLQNPGLPTATVQAPTGGPSLYQI